ncbi:MAG: gluconokinase [Leptolinea sp.]|jgi:gluconokinase|nr:gluconokinase [Leptolinea sp.]
MPDNFVLSIDIGTSATKAVLFDVHMNQTGLARRSYPLILRERGSNEQDADVIIANMRDAVIEVLQSQNPKNLIGIVLSSQMASIMAVDASGNPLTRILTWGDTRSHATSSVLKSDPRAKEIFQVTGCPIEMLYPLSKIRWMIENGLSDPESRYLSVKDYILFHLTGCFITDWSMGSSSGLMDIAKHIWYPEALSLAGISEKNLPALYSTRHIISLPDSELLRQMGIQPGTPLILGAGDAPLSSLGVGALDPGVLVVNVGTSTAARKMVQRPLPDDRQQLWTYVLDETHWVTGGMSSSGGMIYDWFKNIFCVDQGQDAYLEMEKQAENVPPGAEGLIFIPYLAGELCPSWSAGTRGGFHRLDILHHRGHLTRAVLEGITFSIYRIIETIQTVHKDPIMEIRVTGGLAASSLWQRMAVDIFGYPLVIANSNEGSARGGAYLALNILGYLESLEEAEEMTVSDARLLPDARNHSRYMDIYAQFIDFLERTREITGESIHQTDI